MWGSCLLNSLQIISSALHCTALRYHNVARGEFSKPGNSALFGGRGVWLDRGGSFPVLFELSSCGAEQSRAERRGEKRREAEAAWRRRALTRAALWPGGVPPCLRLTEYTQPQVLRPSGFALTSAARTSWPPGRPCAGTPSRSCTACARPTPTSTPTRRVSG